VGDEQSVAVSGASAALGSWELKDAVVLSRVAANRWQCTMKAGTPNPKPRLG